MKNLLKLAVVALGLSCFQVVGHPVCPPYYRGAHGPYHICNEADAECEVKNLYPGAEIIRVMNYTKYYLVTITFGGQIMEIEIEFFC